VPQLPHIFLYLSHHSQISFDPILTPRHHSLQHKLDPIHFSVLELVPYGEALGKKHEGSFERAGESGERPLQLNGFVNHGEVVAAGASDCLLIGIA
jgi:hypothetical protein